MAAPIVSGTAALLMSSRLGLPSSQVRSRMASRVVPVGGVAYGMGAGVISPFAAVGTLTSFDQSGFEKADTDRGDR